MIEEARQACKARADAVEFPVWPENWHAVTLFVSLGTQWRWAIGMEAARIGLDYSAIPVVRAAITPLVEPEHRQPWSVLFPQLRTMEVAVLEADA